MFLQPANISAVLEISQGCLHFIASAKSETLPPGGQGHISPPPPPGEARILAVAPRAALCEQPPSLSGSGYMGVPIPAGTMGCAVGGHGQSLEAAGGGMMGHTRCRASKQTLV